MPARDNSTGDPQRGSKNPAQGNALGTRPPPERTSPERAQETPTKKPITERSDFRTSFGGFCENTKLNTMSGMCGIDGAQALRILCPFRAKMRSRHPFPRALPWAGIFQPFGLGSSLSSQGVRVAPHPLTKILRQQLSNDASAGHRGIRERFFPAVVAITQPLMVEAELVQESCQQAGAAEPALDGLVAKLVGGAVDVTRLEAAAGQEKGEG